MSIHLMTQQKVTVANYLTIDSAIESLHKCRRTAGQFICCAQTT